MLVSGGNDSLLFTYPAASFMAFHPFCFSPRPQAPRFQFAHGAAADGVGPLLLSQHATWLDVWEINGGNPGPEISGRFASGAGTETPLLENGDGDGPAGGTLSDDVVGRGDDVSVSGEGRKAKRRKVEHGGAQWAGPGAILTGAKAGERFKGLETSGVASAKPLVESKPPVLVARIKKSGGEHIACSAISPDGRYLAYSDWTSLRVFYLGRKDEGVFIVRRMKLRKRVPAAHRMTFSGDSEQLIVAGRDGSLVVSVLPAFCPLEKASFSPTFKHVRISPQRAESIGAQWMSAQSMSAGQSTMTTKENPSFS
jgi:hypothetical protein